MPGDPTFWAMFTGVAHAAVGIALIANRAAILATRLGGLMYLCFAAIVWIPGATLHPAEWLRWAGVGISLAMMGGVWSLGDYLSWISAGEIRNPEENDWRARTARVG
jgi:hypothetical protein